jgi:hypothetical protein
MEVPRFWRLKAQRYALVGEVCTDCGEYLFPPTIKSPEIPGDPPQYTVDKESREINVSIPADASGRQGVVYQSSTPATT